MDWLIQDGVDYPRLADVDDSNIVYWQGYIEPKPASAWLIQDGIDYPRFDLGIAKMWDGFEIPLPLSAWRIDPHRIINNGYPYHISIFPYPSIATHITECDLSVLPIYKKCKCEYNTDKKNNSIVKLELSINGDIWYELENQDVLPEELIKPNTKPQGIMYIKKTFYTDGFFKAKISPVLFKFNEVK